MALIDKINAILPTTTAKIIAGSAIAIIIIIILLSLRKKKPIQKFKEAEQEVTEKTKKK